MAYGQHYISATYCPMIVELVASTADGTDVITELTLIICFGHKCE